MHAWYVICATSVLAWSPTDTYAPGGLDCDKTDYVRVAAGGIHPSEREWVANRRVKANKALKEFVTRQDLDFDPQPLLLQHEYTIAHAFSGGGFRAMLTGAGIIKALDERSYNASTDDQTVAGLLQSATYISGLSGGAWLVGSLYMNNFSTIQQLQDRKDIWDFWTSITMPPNPVGYWSDIANDVNRKSSASFDVSLTDFWGRALSHMFVGLPHGGPALSWSDMRQWPWFINQDAPLPLLVCGGRRPGTVLINTNATLFEFTPWEFGSFDPSLNAMSILETAGTRLTNGKPTGNKKCRRTGGFDNAGLVFGTSSSLFNELIIQLVENGGPVGLLIHRVVREFVDHIFLDVAMWTPNPFYKFYSEVGQEHIVAEHPTLALVDGGEDGQNVPLKPLLEHERKTDVIFAWDNSADLDNNWPNGASLVLTYQRQFLVQMDPQNPVSFPHVPDENSFVNLGLTNKPTFFGCDFENQTSSLKTTPPLVVYTANHPYSYSSNRSTFQLMYSPTESQEMIENGFHVASQLNSTATDDWSTCITCAILKRQMERQHVKSKLCEQCFETHCWKGDTNPVNPQNNSMRYNPPVLLIKQNEEVKNFNLFSPCTWWGLLSSLNNRN